MKLKDLYKQENIKSSIIDMKEQVISNNKDITKEIDVGLCDRWNNNKQLVQIKEDQWFKRIWKKIISFFGKN